MAAPAQPSAILRGHRTQVHAAAFVRVGASGNGVRNGTSGETTSSTSNDTNRLATGDGDGYVVLWDLAIVRPRAVWRAHQDSLLGLAGWEDEGGGGDPCQVVTHGRDHRLVVWQLGAGDEARLSTALPLEDGSDGSDGSRGSHGSAIDRPCPWMLHVLEVNTLNFCAFAWTAVAASTSTASARLVAVPNALALEAVDLFHLPSQRRINTVQSGAKDGMLMALALFQHAGTLVLVAAFENGAATVLTLDASGTGPATVRYRAQAHAQPILSLDVAPDHTYFLTSGADAVIVKHPLPVGPVGSVGPVGPVGPVSLDSRLSPTAPASNPSVSLLSAALAHETHPSTPAPPPPETVPLAVVDTKHAGQQGLRIRQDGRIFVTAGWDGRGRVYSAKKMKEVAVLKWHQNGCFAAAFAPMRNGTDAAVVDPAHQHTVKERRLRHAATAHWLALGSKDGKVSLWDIY